MQKSLGKRVLAGKDFFGIGAFGDRGKVFIAVTRDGVHMDLADSDNGMEFSLLRSKLVIEKETLNPGMVITGGSIERLVAVGDGSLRRIVLDTEHGVSASGMVMGEWTSAVEIAPQRYWFTDKKGVVELTQGRNKTKEKVVIGIHEYYLGGDDLRLHLVSGEERKLVVCSSIVGGRRVMGAMVVDDRGHILWQGQEEIMGESVEWPKGESKILGVVICGSRVISYWQVADWGIYAVIGAFLETPFEIMTKPVSMKLKKSSDNPIISPNNDNAWEAFNTFNPAAIYEGGKVHLVYRAQGYDYVSVLGYASSSDGVKVDTRLNDPVYVPRVDFEWVGGGGGYGVNDKFVSGGGFGGCEDPRLTRIGDRVYMTYVAFDGWSPPRVALTSIRLEDFLAHRWLWERPVLITRPGEVNKNCVIFPRKVRGKYVIIHRVFPDILLDYVDDLDFDGTKFLTGQYKIKHRPKGWDSRKLGAGAPPIETPEGWLLIYQAVDERDAGRYKIGAMLLDLENPEIVIARPDVPVLEPTDWYENEGFKGGVAYPCGAVVIGETLFVYYGAADSVVCVATANLKHFVSEIKHNRLTKMDPQQTIKVI